MTIANVSLNNTFNEWRTITNQLVTFANDFESVNLRATSDKTNVAYTQGNTAYTQSNSAWFQANTGRSHANVSFEQANTARNHANAAYLGANTYYVTVYSHANAAHVQANTARNHANLAFDKANNAVTDFSPAFLQANVGHAQANTARNHANVAFGNSNVAYDQANTARNHANAAFLGANTYYVTTFTQANLAFSTSNTYYVTTFTQANTGRNHANAAFGNSNVAYDQANTARTHANAAFLKANTAVTDFSPASIQANTARDHANAAFLKANTVGTLGTQASGSVSITGGNITGISTLQSTSYATSGDTLNRFQVGAAILRGGSPTFYFRDTDGSSAMLHNNSNLFYILRGGTDTETWTQVSGQWPFTLNLNNNDITLGGNLYVVSDIAAFVSDIRLKTNIRQIENALEKLHKIRGIHYNHNELGKSFNLGDQDYVGVIAQEVQEVLPEVIAPAPFDISPETGESKSGENYVTVKYDKIVPLLIEAIKELSNQVETMRQQIEELKK
jgi:hypothetical protein